MRMGTKNKQVANPTYPVTESSHYRHKIVTES